MSYVKTLTEGKRLYLGLIRQYVVKSARERVVWQNTDLQPHERQSLM